MTDKEKAAKVAALKRIREQFKGTSRATQRHRLETALHECGAISTLEARDLLDILHPAGRVQELRDGGLSIVTLWITIQSELGELHRVANYVLTREVSHA